MQYGIVWLQVNKVALKTTLISKAHEALTGQVHQTEIIYV